MQQPKKRKRVRDRSAPIRVRRPRHEGCRPSLYDAMHKGPVLGMDEVGWGCIAGPLYAAGVVLPDDKLVIETLMDLGTTDSKKLTARRRELIFEFMKEQHVFFVTASLHPRAIEEMGATAALDSLFTTIHDTFQSTVCPKTVLLDGNERAGLSFDYRAVKKGDSRSLAIAAASIAAKVTRDAEMTKLAESYPGYGWEDNAGYPTKAHSAALLELGVTDVHRRNTKPVKEALACTQS